MTVLQRSGQSPPTSQARARLDLWAVSCQLYVLVLAGLAVAVASRFRLSLDEKFTLDGDFIQAILGIPDASLDPDDPFRNIALVYRVLGLSHAPDLAAMLALAVFGVGVFAAVRWSELARLTWIGLGAISVSYVLALIYLSQYSKEFASLVVAVLVLLLPRGPRAELVLVGAMICYAVTIRPYWGVVVGLYVLGRILLPRVRGLVPVLLGVLGAYVALQLAFNTILGESLSYSRTAVNELRADINVSVGSLIVDFLPDEVALQWLNAFLVFLSLIAPWPLVLGGSSTYLVMAVVLVYLWGLVGWSLVKIQRERVLGRTSRAATPGARAPLAERGPRPERAVALLLALVVVQTIFEPDYGSYVKHIVPMLPLFLALLPLKAKESSELLTSVPTRSTTPPKPGAVA
ncbi:MAG TPA: hypothetical protein VF642_07065 [Propionibacteriaceae bacterium]|jgi:hypothetical protein